MRDHTSPQKIPQGIDFFRCYRYPWLDQAATGAVLQICRGSLTFWIDADAVNKLNALGMCLSLLESPESSGFSGLGVCTRWLI